MGDPSARTYARWGVKYVVGFSEPNSRAAWARCKDKPGISR